MLRVECPVCHQSVSPGDAEDGTLLVCPACESPVTVIRPRRMLQPPPPPPPKQPRWLLRSFGVLAGVFFALFGCGGLVAYAVYAHFTDPAFEGYCDQAGRFRCEFPGKPYRASPLTFTANGPMTMPLVGYDRTMPDEAYAVVYLDLPKDRLAAGADAILNDACTSVSSYHPAVTSELSRETIVCGGHPGYEVVCTVANTQGKGIVRAILAGQRLYLLFVGGAFIQPDSTRARHFLESFEIER